jgi:hypothetical protein
MSKGVRRGFVDSSMPTVIAVQREVDEVASRVPELSGRAGRLSGVLGPAIAVRARKMGT